MSEHSAEKVRPLPHGKYEVEGAPRERGHLSECFLVAYPEHVGTEYERCTCDDWSPEWTL